MRVPRRGRAAEGGRAGAGARLALVAWVLLTVGFVAQCSPASPVVFRVNVGGPKVADPGGGPAWQADTVSSPAPYTSAAGEPAILSTNRAVSAGATAAPAAVFRDARRVTTTSQTWSFPGPAGEYQVNLYFAEIGTNASATGKRTFGVWLEGGQVEDRLDVFRTAGGADAGIVRSHQVTVLEGQVDVTLRRAVSDPILSAIEVVRIDLPGAWSELPSAPLARDEVSFVQLAGKFYLAGGVAGGVSVADQSVYDPVTGTWEQVAPLPEPLNHVQGVAVGGRIYYLGGLYRWPGPWSDHVWIYDPSTDAFSEGAPMPRGRGAGGVAVHDGLIYYAGGLRDTTAVAWFDVYDPIADAWSSLPDLPTAKDHFHAAVVGDRFYAISGRRYTAGSVLTENVAFDFSEHRWVSGLRPSPIGRGGFAAVALGNEVVLVGGETRQPNIAYRSAQAYDTLTDTWRTLAPMAITRHGIQAAVCGDDLYIAAGASSIGDLTPIRVQAAFSLDGRIDPCLPPPTTTTTSEPEPTTTSEPATTTTSDPEPTTTSEVPTTLGG